MASADRLSAQICSARWQHSILLAGAPSQVILPRISSATSKRPSRHSSRTHTVPLLRVMGGYFFQFTPRPTNLYVALAQRIRAVSAWSIALCSLNYERLLELSLSAAGIQPAVGGPSRQASQVELCLPHGCCHLFCDSVRAISGMVSFAGAQVQTNGPITVVSNPAHHRARIEQDAMPPVMSYFEPSKRTTSGVSFIEAQRALWEELAKGTTTLIIVGVKVRDHDHHIWDPVASTVARVIYCAGPSCGARI
jgi:hypothetical protein